MTEPPLFGSAAGSGPSPAGETPPSPPQGPMPGATPVPPPPGPEPTTQAFGDWSTYGSSSFPPATGSPGDTAQPGQTGPAGWVPPTQPGQPSQTGFTYGPGPTGTPMPTSGAVAAQRSSGRGGIVVIIAVLILVLAGVGGALLVMRTGDSSASATPGRGVVVFSDDFKDPTSGWSTETLPSGTTYKYTDQGYVIVAFGQLDHLSGAPTARPRPQLTASVTATQTATAPEGAGFGVTCVRGTDRTEIRYEFVATAKDHWTVSRLKGALSDTDSVSDILKEGTLARGPGGTPLTVEGTCATQDDGKTTRLVLSVEGVSLVDFTDALDSLPDDGWYPELIVSSQDVPSTVTATHFEVRTVPK